MVAAVAARLGGRHEQLQRRAAEIGAGVEHRIAPARIAGQRAAGEVVADAGRVAEGIAEGVERQRGDEEGRGVAAERDLAEVLAGQADEGVARPEGIGAEAARCAGVGAHERLQREQRREAAAQILAAAGAEPAGGHVAVVHAPDAAGAAGRLRLAGAHVEQAGERDAGLRLRRAGRQGDGGDQRGAMDGNALHGGLLVVVERCRGALSGWPRRPRTSGPARTAPLR